MRILCLFVQDGSCLGRTAVWWCMMMHASPFLRRIFVGENFGGGICSFLFSLPAPPPSAHGKRPPSTPTIVCVVPWERWRDREYRAPPLTVPPCKILIPFRSTWLASSLSRSSLVAWWAWIVHCRMHFLRYAMSLNCLQVLIIFN